MRRRYRKPVPTTTATQGAWIAEILGSVKSLLAAQEDICNIETLFRTAADSPRRSGTEGPPSPSPGDVGVTWLASVFGL